MPPVVDDTAPFTFAAKRIPTTMYQPAKIAFNRIYDGLSRNAEYFEPRFFPFGLVATFGFPLYYLIWHVLFPQPYENLPLRLLGSALFVPIMLVKRWPDSLRRYLPLYWYLSTLYALPFFFTFMLLKNNGSIPWLLSALTAAFLMVLLLDWVNLFIQFAIGAGGAWLAYDLSGATAGMAFLNLDYVPVYLFVIILGAVANYSSEVVKRERLRAMQSTASMIAHELRTPLLGIKAGASGVKLHLPILLDSYQLARAAGLPVVPVREVHLESMRSVLERIEGEVNYSNIVIDMVLANAKPFSFRDVVFSHCSMAACLDIALRRYPFATQRERALLRLEASEDFIFLGNELLMVHVFFNLIKNALRHISQAGKGDILIRLHAEPEGGRLTFLDTGPGIPAHVLPHVFTRFYSWSYGHDDGTGSGIGLAYCRSVMQSFGGQISCRSTIGEFSEFTLTFPTAVN
jgi:two-component system CAI-1 autoinducer sensor kinase/phosphatase CqsS